MNVEELKSQLEGAQFAAASHLRTVEQQAKIIAGNSDKALVAEALAVFDLMLVGCTVPNFADYQNGDGEEIGARMDALHAALKAGQAAPIQSGDVRNQALEEAATYLADVHSIGLADEIRALACNAPSIKGQVVPAMSVPEHDYSGPVLQNEAEINYAEGWNACLAALASTPSAAMQWQDEPTIIELAQFIRKINGNNKMGAGALAERITEWLAAAPTPAAQPQAGGRELTGPDIIGMAAESGLFGTVPQMLQFARAVADHITGTKGATE